MKTAEMVCNDLTSFENEICKIRSALTALRFDFGNDCINVEYFIGELAAVSISLAHCVNRLFLLKALFSDLTKIEKNSEKKESC